MPRPSKPLISRTAAAASALRIIDEQGLDALSLEKLADAIGVRAPSLYHHFRDKAEILAEVARHIVTETPLPRAKEDEAWTEWFVRLTMNFRRTILRHRNAALVLLQFLPRDLLTGMYENAARRLEGAGVSPAGQLLVLDGLEKLTLGAALVEAMHPTRSTELFPIDNEARPTLSGAVLSNPRTSEAMFEAAVRSLLAGVAAELDVVR